MVIRNANKSDINKIATMQKLMALETENITLEDSKLTKGIEKIVYNSQIGQYYVVEYQNDIIGCFMTTFEWSDWRNGWWIWIQSVYVNKEFRKQGIFKKMFTHIKNQVLLNPDFYGIRLYVDKFNEPAKTVYKKAGMDDSHYLMFEWDC